MKSRTLLRRITAGLLAVCVLVTSIPDLAYAAATPSDAESEDSSFSDPVDFTTIDGETIISRYEKSFEYCPITPDEVLAYNPRTRFVASTAVIAILTALFAACGLYLSSTDAIKDLASSLDGWIRRAYGNSKTIMTAWAAVLTFEYGVVVKNIKELYPVIKEYFKTALKGYGTDTVDFSYVSGNGSLDVSGPYNTVIYDNLGYSSDPKYKYLGSYSNVDFSRIYDLYLYTNKAAFDYEPVCITCQSDGSVAFFYLTESSYSYYYLRVTYLSVDSSGNRSFYESTSNCTMSFSGLSKYFSLPIFTNVTYAKQYCLYGTLDGQYVSTDNSVSLKADNAWKGLSDNFISSDSINILDEDSSTSLMSALAAAGTVADVQAALKQFGGLTLAADPTVDVEPSIITPAMAYSALSYVVASIAAYSGATLTVDQIDTFITKFYGDYVSGTAALKEDQALQVVRKFVVINGGGDPDDDNDKNKFKVLKPLAISLAAFLAGLGLGGDAADFSQVVEVSPNVQVVPELETDPDTDPSGGTEEGTPDKDTPWLPNITGWLEKLLNVLNAIKDLILSIPSALTTIVTKITEIPDLIRDVGVKILALPDVILEFFTVDTAIVADAYEDLQDTFESRFSGITAIAAFFDFGGYSFSDAPPVFTMAVPDCLKFAFPDQDTIVIMDLTPYATYFYAARTILSASIWVMFVMWLLNQFDVKFHIG